MLERADTAPELHRIFRGFQDRFHSLAVDAFASKGTVEINHMQPFKALILKGFGLCSRVFIIDGCLIHVAELQAHALTVFQIDGGKKDHNVRASISGNWQ